MQVKIGKGLTLEVETTRFSAEVNDFLFQMGLKTVLQDSHGAVTKESVKNGEDLTDQQVTDKVRAESLGLAQKKLDALYSGDTRSVTREHRTEEEKVRFDIVRGHVMKAIRDAKRDPKTLDKNWFAKADAMVYQSIGADIDKEVKRVLADRAKSAAALDLSGLGL